MITRQHKRRIERFTKTLLLNKIRSAIINAHIIRIEAMYNKRHLHSPRPLIKK
jgi:hypothetical protein